MTLFVVLRSLYIFQFKPLSKVVNFNEKKSWMAEKISSVMAMK